MNTLPTSWSSWKSMESLSFNTFFNVTKLPFFSSLDLFHTSMNWDVFFKTNDLSPGLFILSSFPSETASNRVKLPSSSFMRERWNKTTAFFEDKTYVAVVLSFASKFLDEDALNNIISSEEIQSNSRLSVKERHSTLRMPQQFLSAKIDEVRVKTCLSFINCFPPNGRLPSSLACFLRLLASLYTLISLYDGLMACLRPWCELADAATAGP